MFDYQSITELYDTAQNSRLAIAVLILKDQCRQDRYWKHGTEK